jgi:phosphonate transport system permease protein
MRIFGVLLVAYLVYAASQLDLGLGRFVSGLGEGGRFLARMFPPNFERWELLLEGMLESIQIAVLATVFGILLSLPLGLMAARNIAPWWLSSPVRAFIAVCRSLHYVIVAILFVKAIGFGALAGVCALIIASIGFVAKLFAEAVEEISMKPVEAVRATGASAMAVLLYAVLPQVASRFVGFSLYQLDSNLRNSTLVGVVGAGGIGGTLFAAFKRFDYDFVSAILISIIALILLAEFVSGRIRAAMQ